MHIWSNYLQNEITLKDINLQPWFFFLSFQYESTDINMGKLVWIANFKHQYYWSSKRGFYNIVRPRTCDFNHLCEEIQQDMAVHLKAMATLRYLRLKRKKNLNLQRKFFLYSVISYSCLIRKENRGFIIDVNLLLPKLVQCVLFFLFCTLLIDSNQHFLNELYVFQSQTM